MDAKSNVRWVDAVIRRTLSIALGSDWMLILLVPMAVILHFGVVKREERYLETRFGENYHAYLNRVPRYGLPMARH